MCSYVCGVNTRTVAFAQKYYVKCGSWTRRRRSCTSYRYNYIVCFYHSHMFELSLDYFALSACTLSSNCHPTRFTHILNHLRFPLYTLIKTIVITVCSLHFLFIKGIMGFTGLSRPLRPFFVRPDQSTVVHLPICPQYFSTKLPTNIRL